MALYSKVYRRVWRDAKFRALSDRGKLLWFYLLTGPDVTSMPGPVVGGEGHFAEAMGWNIGSLREAFREVLAKGMAKVDREACLVFLPNAYKYNRPESPNVVRSWANHFDELPECALKVEVYQHLKALVEGLGEGFRKAFGEVFPKGMPNQEPEPEQEQEQEQEVGGQAPLQPPAAAESLPESLRTEQFQKALTDWRKHRKEIRKKWTPSMEEKQIKRLADWGAERAVAAIDHSIANGWLGIHEAKENGDPRLAAKSESVAERYARLKREG
jgi:hypothetical protein